MKCCGRALFDEGAETRETLVFPTLTDLAAHPFGWSLETLQQFPVKSTENLCEQELIFLFFKKILPCTTVNISFYFMDDTSKLHSVLIPLCRKQKSDPSLHAIPKPHIFKFHASQIGLQPTASKNSKCFVVNAMITGSSCNGEEAFK